LYNAGVACTDPTTRVYGCRKRSKSLLPLECGDNSMSEEEAEAMFGEGPYVPALRSEMGILNATGNYYKEEMKCPDRAVYKYEPEFAAEIRCHPDNTKNCTKESLCSYSMAFGQGVAMGWGDQKCEGWCQRTQDVMRVWGLEGINYARDSVKTDVIKDSFYHHWKGFAYIKDAAPGGPWSYTHPCVRRSETLYETYPMVTIMSLGPQDEDLSDCHSYLAAEAENCQEMYMGGHDFCACDLRVSNFLHNAGKFVNTFANAGVDCVLVGGLYANMGFDWGMHNLPRWPRIVHNADTIYQTNVSEWNTAYTSLGTKVKYVNFLNPAATVVRDPEVLENGVSGKFNIGMYNTFEYPSHNGHKIMAAKAETALKDCISGDNPAEGPNVGRGAVPWPTPGPTPAPTKPPTTAVA
jgi:hypothetical protein